MIASIQGGETQQAEPKCPGQLEANSAGQAQKECGNAKASREQAAHPSEITLPAPK
jgi:hypothetical protein